ncbi:valine--tRNA ligase [Candidatus Pacearchaeota archaeon]|nr:valine--tRNA ligase [Candidatus Pacearchaeota archaeon]
MTLKPKKKGYDFTEVEAKIKRFWEDKKIFKTDLTKKKIYAVDTPPPTVSGKMHIGHAFSYAQQDFIVRFQRMNGGVYYPFGTDDNGLPTERLVEKLKKVRSKNMSRAEFIELCLKTLEEIRPDFIEDWKSLGISADYEKCYSTIDNQSRKLSQKGFLDLFKKGEIYKAEFPTIWCCECQTAIAQAELEDKELPGKFSTLKFKIKETGKELLIATTRPELLPACVAIFVHPEDKRFKKIIGKTAVVQLFNQEVPILADESADQEKGTGVLMICSYGDKFDVDAINRHNLEPKVVFNKDGTATYPGYEGLKLKAARKKVLEELDKANLIAEQKEITHTVNTHDKCGTEIEFLPTPQWFIRIMDKKKKLIEQGDKINWYPKYMHKRYDNWVNGLEWDWNISRNRHFGIPIPVWECEKCNEIILAKESELPIDPLQSKKKCPKCGEKAIPEEMVLDTWATSSLSPQIAGSLVDDKIKIPFSLRPQAHDIIRTWAFYTIARAYMQENKIPWKDIVISGNVSLKGEKMSKSKGNIIDPETLITNYGSDALRFWASGSTLGSDLDYQEKDLVTGKKTVNKLWNAAKFVFMNLEDYDGKSKPKKLEKVDQEFLKHLNYNIKIITESFEKYRYSVAKSKIERFFWDDFADNYIEIVKKRVYQEEGDKRLSAQYTLYKTILALSKLFAPIMPFVTEEIYQTYFINIEKDISIHTSSWPKLEKDSQPSTEFTPFCTLLSKVRQAKSNAQKSMNSEIILTLDKKNIEMLGEMMEDFNSVTNSKETKEGKQFRVDFVEPSKE